MSATLTETDLKVGDFTSRGAIPKLYGDALVAAAQADPRIVCLSADLTPATETDVFRDTLPERFHNFGIAEANMMGAAGGMATCGEMPFVHTFSVFATRRAYDQVAMQIAYPRANVKIVGFLPGLTTLLGVSHQAIDDIALMRALPNMTIIEPSGPEQIAAAVRAAAAHDGPVYLRMRRPESALGADFRPRGLTIGQAEVRRAGDAAVVFACGALVQQALTAAATLAQRGRQVAVVNLHTIKPLDAEAVRHWARATGVVVTAENHTTIGGLGSAVAEVLAEAGSGAAFARIGVQDTYAEGGSTPYLFRKYGLDADAIVAALERLREQRGA
ncbi:MAG: transketolase [Proteobacteria bacterium]|nr:transketolase [Pseudomonadota bacterium]